MELIMLGTGNAVVTECYNTCFLLKDNDEYFLVDGGGGNTILRQLKYAGVDWRKVQHIFVTHKHLDHIMGIMWLVRMICQYSKWNKYEGVARIYASPDVTQVISSIAHLLLRDDEVCYLGKTLLLIPIEDKKSFQIINRKITFFDINSVQTQQFGFYVDDKKLVYCGDEPCNEITKTLVQGCEWLIHEAFCLYSEADVFKPYEKHHSTVKDACELAESSGVQNLVLVHTEDKNITDKKTLYLEEGRRYFSRNLFVPMDLDVITVQG